jgi:hypothetical protein
MFKSTEIFLYHLNQIFLRQSFNQILILLTSNRVNFDLSIYHADCYHQNRFKRFVKIFHFREKFKSPQNVRNTAQYRIFYKFLVIFCLILQQLQRLARHQLMNSVTFNLDMINALDRLNSRLELNYSCLNLRLK